MSKETILYVLKGVMIRKMKRIWLFVIIAFFCLTNVYSATIFLKKGSVVYGKIVEKTQEFIKVDIGIGTPITYSINEIQSIDETNYETFNYGETFATLNALFNEFGKWRKAHDSYPQKLCDLGNDNPIQPTYEFKNMTNIPLGECYDMKYGYIYELIESDKDQFLIVANPAKGINAEYAGKYSFCLMEDGAVRVDKEGKNIRERAFCSKLPTHEADREQLNKAKELIAQKKDPQEELQRLVEKQTGKKVNKEDVLKELMGPVTDINRYEELMAMEDTVIVQHFPKKIPQDATKKVFYYQQPIMMGDGHIQLRLGLPSDEIKKLHEEFSKQKIKSYMGSDAAREELRLLSFITSESEKNYKFSTDYEIILLGQDSDKGQRGGHGSQYGVAISDEKNEIVYWVDVW